MSYALQSISSRSQRNEIKTSAQRSKPRHSIPAVWISLTWPGGRGGAGGRSAVQIFAVGEAVKRHEGQRLNLGEGGMDLVERTDVVEPVAQTSSSCQSLRAGQRSGQALTCLS